MTIGGQDETSEIMKRNAHVDRNHICLELLEHELAFQQAKMRLITV